VIRSVIHRPQGERFDVIHSTGPDVLCPTVTTLHCCTGGFAEELETPSPDAAWKQWGQLRRWHNMMSYRVIALFERFVVRRGARSVIVVSNALASEAQRHNNVPDARLNVIPNGVNLDEFRPPSDDRRRVARARLGVRLGTKGRCRACGRSRTVAIER
jgi:hypothetical protein